MHSTKLLITDTFVSLPSNNWSALVESYPQPPLLLPAGFPGKNRNGLQQERNYVLNFPDCHLKGM
jgi:hypothetical protein